ncbi:unnamed protein product, partial [Cyprideis torosa]
MVGGEKAGDSQLVEKRSKRKRAAEKRVEALAQALAMAEEDDGAALTKVYDDINEELRSKTELAKKYKGKVRALETEIRDIQQEFEADRMDYLETIRRQDRQLILLQMILERAQQGMKKECNYNNLEKIRNEATWDDDTQRWIIPEFVITRTKLPPAGQFQANPLEGRSVPSKAFGGQVSSKQSLWRAGPGFGQSITGALPNGHSAGANGTNQPRGNPRGSSTSSKTAPPRLADDSDSEDETKNAFSRNPRLRCAGGEGGGEGSAGGRGGGAGGGVSSAAFSPADHCKTLRQDRNLADHCKTTRARSEPRGPLQDYEVKIEASRITARLRGQHRSPAADHCKTTRARSEKPLEELGSSFVSPSVLMMAAFRSSRLRMRVGWKERGGVEENQKEQIRPMRLERSTEENIAGNYFKPKRRQVDVISKAHDDANKASNPLFNSNGLSKNKSSSFSFLNAAPTSEFSGISPRKPSTNVFNGSSGLINGSNSNSWGGTPSWL